MDSLDHALKNLQARALEQRTIVQCAERSKKTEVRWGSGAVIRKLVDKRVVYELVRKEPDDRVVEDRK